MRFLVALARERHFGRAADVCCVSQPTLSARIRQLEQELGVLIVERGHRSYQGLTGEGERVLHWAKRIVADCEAMKLDVRAMHDELTGHMALGVIPSALPFAPLLTTPFRKRYPRVSLTVLSLSSVEIQRDLHNFEIDAGLTYIDNEPLSKVRCIPLYRERYALLTAAPAELASGDVVSWAEAADMPLCLLTADMQNRRIIDNIFRRVNREPRPVVETNSIINLYAQVRLGRLATILPERFVDVIAGVDGVRALPLVDPDVAFTVGVVVSDREPPSPYAQAIFRCVEDADLRPEPFSDPATVDTPTG